MGEVTSPLRHAGASIEACRRVPAVRHAFTELLEEVSEEAHAGSERHAVEAAARVVILRKVRRSALFMLLNRVESLNLFCLRTCQGKGLS